MYLSKWIIYFKCDTMLISLKIKMLMFQNSISEMGELLAKYKSHSWFLPDSSTSAP